jgi:hypothetical protein
MRDTDTRQSPRFDETAHGAVHAREHADQSAPSCANWLVIGGASGVERGSGTVERHELSIAATRVGAHRGGALAADDPVRDPIAKNYYFDLAFSRYSGWCAWLCTYAVKRDAGRKVLAFGSDETPEGACRDALKALQHSHGQF